MTLSELAEAYQALLEGNRAHPDDELLEEDMHRARTALEVAWMNRMVES